MQTRTAALAAELEAEPGRERQRREKPAPRWTPWHLNVLKGLRMKPLYEGIDYETEPGKARALRRRRAKNRVAKQSRKISRAH